MDGDKRLPQELFDRLQDALGSGLTESRKALRLLLEFANKNLKGQVAGILTPVGEDSLRFFEATDETFIADDFPLVPVGSSIAGFVYLSGQSMGLDDAQQSSHFYAEIDEKSGFHTKEYLATPVVLGRNVLGVLTIANRSEPMENSMFSAAELRLADQYAHLCALVLDHDNQINRQTGATSQALAKTFAGYTGDQPPAGGFSSDSHSKTDDLRAQVKEALEDLHERDLELVRDIAERLADLAGQNPSKQF